MMGQIPDESHGIRKQDFIARRKSKFSCGRVQGGKKLVLLLYPGMSQRIEQRGLSGVGIPGNGNTENSRFGALLPVQFPVFDQSLQLLLQSSDPLLDVSAVAFQLALARSSGSDSSPQP